MATTQTPHRTAFLGLGVMGFPMAGHLVTAGHQVQAWNRGAERARRWHDEHPGGQVCATPAEAAAGCDAVFMCVSNGAAVREVLFGEGGAAAALAQGSVVVDHSTISAEDAREIGARLRGSGIGFVDAPVSGGQAGAVNGQLTIMAGGDAADFERVDPYLAAYGAKRRLLGPTGFGQLAKMVNQICIAGVVQGLAEAVAFAQRTGQDVEAVFDVVGAGAAGSWQLTNRHQTMARGEFDFGFAVEHMRKDLGFCLDEAARAGASCRSPPSWTSSTPRSWSTAGRAGTPRA